MCRIAGPTSPNDSTAELVQRARARECAGDEQHRHVLRQLEDLAGIRLRHAPRAGRDRAADDAVACGPSQPRQRVGEEDALRERQREPVGEAEVGIGLGERRRDPHRRGGEHHRPGDVAAAAEDDVGAAAAQDRAAGRRRDDRPPERARRAPATAGAGSR